MKKTLLLTSLFAFGLSLQAQDIVAVAGVERGKIEFQDFRTINLNTPNSGNVLISKNDNLEMSAAGKTCNCNKYIAAMTMGSDGKIYYIPMTQASLKSVDSNSKTIVSQSLKDVGVDSKSQGSYFARMTTGIDGNMYALNNDGTVFLRISGSGDVQNLGAVNGLIAQVKELGDEKFAYGGDMVADAFGNVFVISAYGNVFKIDVNSLSSTYLGRIKNLPENYTANGAAVTKDGQILLATSSEHGLYLLNIDTMEAKFHSNSDTPIYDLYSPYFLRQNEASQSLDSHYSLYPTIVKTSELNIVSKVNESTKLDITVWNLNNKRVYSNSVAVKSIGDFKVNLNGALQPGIYILKAVNQNGVEVINTKFTLMK